MSSSLAGGGCCSFVGASTRCNHRHPICLCSILVGRCRFPN
jgi:hypothetical protein